MLNYNKDKPKTGVESSCSSLKGGVFMKRNLHAGSNQTGGFSLNVFSDDALEDIHLATLEVLQ